MGDYMSMNAEKLIEILNERLRDLLMFAIRPVGERILITSHEFIDFTILDMSYNLRILTGFYHDTFPMKPINEYRSHFTAIDLDEETIQMNKDDYLMIGTRGRTLGYSHVVENIVDLKMVVRDLLLPEISFRYFHNDDRTIVFYSSTPFEVSDASENVLKLLGIKELYTKSIKFPHVVASSAGYYQLTPILYLTSNLGTTHYSYVDNDCTNQKILMKINNYFIHGFPIVCHNFEYSSIVNTSALSEACFKLVDANFKPVKLLSPMYLSITAIGVP